VPTANALDPDESASGVAGGAARCSATRMSVLDCRFDAIIAPLATKADLAGVQADIQRWMLATVIGLFLGFGGLFLAMSNALKPVPAAAANATPIVISSPAAVLQPPATPGK